MIAKTINQNPQKVKQALAKGKSLLPQIQNSSNGGIDILQRSGVTRGFAQGVFSKYGGLASKFGISEDVMNSVLSGLPDGQVPTLNRQQRRQAERLNLSKYTKV